MYKVLNFQMSYILTIALVTVIAAAFDLPTYTYGKNLQAFVVILLCYGYVTVSRKGVKFAYKRQQFSQRIHSSPIVGSIEA